MIFITFTKNKHVKEINSLDTENKKSLKLDYKKLRLCEYPSEKEE